MPRRTRFLKESEELCGGALLGALEVAAARYAARPICTPGYCVKGITVYTVGTPRIFAEQRLTAENVLAMRNGFEVRGIDATMIATEMVDLESIWDRTDEQSVAVLVGV